MGGLVVGRGMVDGRVSVVDADCFLKSTTVHYCLLPTECADVLQTTWPL